MVQFAVMLLKQLPGKLHVEPQAAAKRSCKSPWKVVFICRRLHGIVELTGGRDNLITYRCLSQALHTSFCFIDNLRECSISLRQLSTEQVFLGVVCLWCAVWNPWLYLIQGDHLQENVHKRLQSPNARSAQSLSLRNLSFQKLLQKTQVHEI